jgi:Tol biopolymer transport system component
MDGDGSNLTRLTDSPGNDRSPSWSTDGRWVVFETDRDGNSEVYGVGLDGTGPVNLSNDEAIDWAPAWAPEP